MSVKIMDFYAEMPTWWFAGMLAGAVSMANDELFTESVRRLMAEHAVDLAEHWEIGETVCRRIR